MASRKAVPDSVIHLERQFEQFRSTRAGRAKLPESLWQAAMEQARQHGVNVVAHTLRLDYNALKKRLGGSSLPQREPGSANFVELMSGGGAPADEYVIEFESCPSPRMRVQWRGAVPPDWSALLRAWREVAG